jgi:hypothetical protein
MRLETGPMRSTHELNRRASGKWRTLAGALGYRGDETRWWEKCMHDKLLGAKDRGPNQRCLSRKWKTRVRKAAAGREANRPTEKPKWEQQIDEEKSKPWQWTLRRTQNRKPKTEYDAQATENRSDPEKAQRENRPAQQEIKNSKFPLKSSKITTDPRRSLPSLSHLIIGIKNYFWFTNPRLKAEIESLEKWQGAPTPLGPIYRPIQNTEMPLEPNTTKIAK